MRYVFLNSIALNMFNKPFFKLLVTKVKHDVLKQLASMMNNVECYIRHKATVELLNKEFGLKLEPSSDLYKYREGDVLFIVSLKKPIRGKELDNITLDDIDIWMVEVFNA